METEDLPPIRFPRRRYRYLMHFTDLSRTEQSHAAASDINTIVRRFAGTGQLPPPTRPGVYADVTNLQGDLMSRLEWAAQVIASASAATDTPPADAQPNPTHSPPGGAGGPAPQAPPPST